MIEPSYLTNQFLIAMPTLADPNFFQTVTYISEHNASGALGLVINRPLNLTLGQLLEHLQIVTDRPDLAALPIYHGGPVQPEQGFVVHSPVGHWGATLRVTDDIVRGAVEANMGGGGPLGPAAWQACNVNALTDLDNRDPISGFPVYKALLCEVVPRAG